MSKDFKYLIAYYIPIFTGLGLYYGGIVTYLAVGFSFLVIPLLELVLSKSKTNLSEEEAADKSKKKLFDILLYLNLPMVYGLLAYYILWLNSGTHEAYEYVGQTLSMGVLFGVNGINVGHELGHRTNRWENTIAQLLLLPSFYMHFFVEHNLGHHKHVSTPEDPSTARLNEAIYVFWIRSVYQSYVNAWKLEAFRLRQMKQQFWSVKNKMLWFTLVQISYIGVLYFLLTPSLMLYVVLPGIIGFLLLESINYIEHYGLMRKKSELGNYERVTPKHSWNSNHYLGRIVLYELTRHSDHHYLSTKKYQILDHHEESPQLPTGYPGSILLTLIPPLWFRVMNPRINTPEPYHPL